MFTWSSGSAFRNYLYGGNSVVAHERIHSLTGSLPLTSTHFPTSFPMVFYIPTPERARSGKMKDPGNEVAQSPTVTAEAILGDRGADSRGERQIKRAKLVQTEA